MEVARLKREQRATEEEVQRMWRRVRDAERRPKQALAFLARVLGDHELLRHLMGGACGDAGREKCARLLLEGQSGSREPPAATLGVGEELGLMTYSLLSFENYKRLVGCNDVLVIPGYVKLELLPTELWIRQSFLVSNNSLQ